MASYEEYLVFERANDAKYEFVDGEILPRPGISVRGCALASRFIAAVEMGRPPGCIGLASTQRIRVLATGRTIYAHLSMVCGTLQIDPDDAERETITNPTLLVEIIPEGVDRSSTWCDYQLISSLQEYVLLDQTQPRVEVYQRSRGWECLDVTEGVVKLATGAALPLSVLYRDLPE